MEIQCSILRNNIIKKVRKELYELLGDTKPTLAIVQVGNDPRSNSYIKSKIDSCKEANIATIVVILETQTTELELLQLVDKLNKNDSINGILIQSPLPIHINEDKIMQSIKPTKDVDCFNYENVCRMLNNESKLLPCTPKGIVEILNKFFYDNLDYTNILIIGKGKTIGRYLVPILNNEGATCLQIHSKSSREIEEYIDEFKPDAIISCVGKDGLMDRNTFKNHKPLLLIDCGISFQGKQLRGDFLREDYTFLDNNRISYTPCKGGVGLTTVASVLTNLVELIKTQNNK